MAGLQGLGFGSGGFITAVPDIGLLSAITLRMVQKLSLLYGFEYSTEDENTGLLIAAASAAGVDLGRDFIESKPPKKWFRGWWIVSLSALGAEVAEKSAGRIFPVVSAGVGATINYYFVRGWGRRAQKHFLARHEWPLTARGAGLPAAGFAPVWFAVLAALVRPLSHNLRLGSPPIIMCS